MSIYNNPGKSLIIWTLACHLFGCTVRPFISTHQLPTLLSLSCIKPISPSPTQPVKQVYYILNWWCFSLYVMWLESTIWWRRQRAHSKHAILACSSSFQFFPFSCFCSPPCLVQERERIIFLYLQQDFCGPSCCHVHISPALSFAGEKLQLFLPWMTKKLSHQERNLAKQVPSDL